MKQDRIRVRVDLFKRIIQEQERLRRVALTSQIISLLALGVAMCAMILAAGA